MEFNDISPLIGGKTCLVTGGGGSIGGELVRSLARLGAEKVVILDICENGAYDIKCEIGDTAVIEIASVRDFDRLDDIMKHYRPSFVFHAAAHKHVPFMEANPEEAVKNNIIGTKNMIHLAEKYNTGYFVLISTDKAVEPISVMGASKRVCEMLLYEKSLTASHTRFITVRFGNVIGSNGSVIPLFQKQLKTGRITVTDREVTRYFMTIEQAVSLVLLSLSEAKGGEVFVLDMGERKKILDIAEQIIRESGKEPYTDVKIDITSLRKGDKLHEKLFYDFETLHKTRFDKILRTSGSSTDGLSEAVDRLYKMALIPDRNGIRSLLLEITNRSQS